MKALPRYLAILAAIGAVSIALMLWTFSIGMSEHWRTMILLLTVFINGVLVHRFILKEARQTLKAQIALKAEGAAR